MNGVGGLAARLPARASAASSGTNRDSSITNPVATSQCGLYGAASGLSSAPYVSCNPSKPEPLFADDELNS